MSTKHDKSLMEKVEALNVYKKNNFKIDKIYQSRTSASKFEQQPCHTMNKNLEYTTKRNNII